MDSAFQPHRGNRGTERMLAHFAVLSIEDIRPSAADRLERELGHDFVRFLFLALVGDHGMRPRDLVA